jgi:hypothetical protein
VLLSKATVGAAKATRALFPMTRPTWQIRVGTNAQAPGAQTCAAGLFALAAGAARSHSLLAASARVRHAGRPRDRGLATEPRVTEILVTELLEHLATECVSALPKTRAAPAAALTTQPIARSVAVATKKNKKT